MNDKKKTTFGGLIWCMVAVGFIAACETTRYVATELPDTVTHGEETETSTAPSSAPTDSETQPDTATDTGSDTHADSATATDTDTATGDTNSATDSLSTDDSETQSESETDTPTDTESDTETGSDSGTATDTDMDTETASDSDSESDSDTVTVCDLPAAFKWISSTSPLITPLWGDIAIKDPTLVFFEDEWHIYATTKPDADNWGLAYVHFTDWADAGVAEKVHASDNPNLQGYRAAPQLFQFSGDNKWYLIYQSPDGPAFSTNDHPGAIDDWTEKQNLMSQLPSINGNTIKGIDYWVICDDDTCYLFFSGNLEDAGHLYRTSTPKSMFPGGFEYDRIDVLMQAQTASGNDLRDASNVYKIQGRNEYLLLVSAIGDNGYRYFRAFHSDSLGGNWEKWADTERYAFASPFNVSEADWAQDGVNHGEMLRAGYDESMTINTCHMRYIFQGRTRIGANYDYDLNEYSLGLLTDARDTAGK